MFPHKSVVVDTTKVDIFKQITTVNGFINLTFSVVVDTTKVDIFKQITTVSSGDHNRSTLLLIPQR